MIHRVPGAVCVASLKQYYWSGCPRWGLMEAWKSGIEWENVLCSEEVVRFCVVYYQWSFS